MYIKKFESFNNKKLSDKSLLIHTTTPYIANIIIETGFNPSNYIDYKYYSEFGKEKMAYIFIII